LHDITCGGSIWVPKNTKVRSTFREVLHNVHGFVLPEVLKDVGGKDGGRDGEDGMPTPAVSVTGHKGNVSKVSVSHALKDQDSQALQPAGQVHAKEAVTRKGSQLPQPRARGSENTENVMPLP